VASPTPHSDNRTSQDLAEDRAAMTSASRLLCSFAPLFPKLARSRLYCLAEGVTYSFPCCSEGQVILVGLSWVGRTGGIGGLNRMF